MNRNSSIILSVLCAVLLPLFACDQLPGASCAVAHGQGPAPEPAQQTLTLFTPKVELYMEYPSLVRGEPAKFVSHFTVLATGEPVRSGSLTFEGSGQEGTT